MKIVTLIAILLLTILTSCSVEDKCDNRFDFISTNESIPILNLDFSSPPDSILEQMNSLYGIDLCQKCNWVEFKTPFEIEGKKGFLKLMADFDYPYCSNCPIAMRNRHYFEILINLNNQILAEGDLVQINSLETEIKQYLNKVGNNDNFPESYKKVNYFIKWDSNSDPQFINSVFTCIYSAHLDFIESKLDREEINFCSLDQEGIKTLKNKYPLRIEIYNGKSIEMPSPKELTKMLKNIEKGSESTEEK